MIITADLHPLSLLRIQLPLIRGAFIPSGGGFLGRRIAFKLFYERFRGQHEHSRGDYERNVDEHERVVGRAVNPEVSRALRGCVRAEREHARKHVRNISHNADCRRAERELNLVEFKSV